MDVKSYINSTYTIEKQIGHKKNILLIRSKIDNNLYVLKCIKVYERAIYDILKDSDIEGIPQIYELMESPERIYVVEEYIEGRNIDEFLSGLKSEAGDIEETFVDIICKICDILSCIHNLVPPVIHRDIKPENIIISDNGVVHLIDFNIARRYTGMSQKDTVAMGTSYFAAPEQYGSGESDNKTDIYGLGATIKYLATANGINSSRINAFISKSMEYAPESRFESAEDAKQFLINTKETLTKTDSKDKKWSRSIPYNYTCNECGETFPINSYRRYIKCPNCSNKTEFRKFTYREIDWNSSAYSEVNLWMDCPVCRSPNMYLGPEGKKWKCPDCGYTIKKEEKDNMVFWLCDDCETYLNIQENFNTEKGIWKCTECGYENDVTDENII